MSSSRRRYRAGGLAAVLGLLLLAGCGTKTDHRSISAASVSGKPGFAPETLRVHKGRNVDLNVGNTTDKTHGFTIDGYGVADTVDPGKAKKIEFKADKAGEFRIFCQLHPAHQTAKLIVK